MLKDFKIWYNEYIETNDNKFSNNLKILETQLSEEKLRVEKYINVRMRNIQLPDPNLDIIIKKGNESVFKIVDRIEEYKKIREEKKSLRDKKAKEIYEKLLKHPKISKIEISDRTLHVITKKLKVNSHNIGNYKLSYSLPNSICIENLEYVVNGQYDHWHVSGKDPCLASWKPILWRQLDTYQLFLFVDTLIHYLLLSDSTHAYIKFEDWIKIFSDPDRKESKRNESSRYIGISNITYSGIVTRLINSNTDTNTFTYWSTTA